MASNSFGTIFKITTWGESHGKAIGVVIDGCPAGLELSEEDINRELIRRAPGSNRFVTPRKEKDRAEIYSGLFEGKTTGTPLSIIIFNHDADSSSYDPIKDYLRPGHANFTYLKKYGLFDYRGGGRASARETAARVAAGAVAKKLLSHYSIQVYAWLNSLGSIELDLTSEELLKEEKTLSSRIESSALFCPVLSWEQKMIAAIEEVMIQGDSLGGSVAFLATGLSAGLGDPIYEKLEAKLAAAMMSLPASKGFEIGSGFAASRMRGSVHNDSFAANRITNHAGGVLGGISTGMPLYGKVAFKPTSSIKINQETLDLEGNKVLFNLPNNSRHDPCLSIRAVPVVEAMMALVLADALLLNQSAKIS